MAVIAFFSAKGSPGVTMTAMLCAALWPRPALLVDCDPAGGDIGLRLPDPNGRPLDSERGLLSLLPLARREIDPPVLLAHAQQALGGGEVILGLPGPEQALAVGPLWNNLARAFVSLAGYDVILDLGRIDSRSAMLGLLRSADVGVCVLAPTLTNVVGTRNRLRLLVPEVVGVGGVRGPRMGLVVHSAKGRRDVAGAVHALQNEDRLLRFYGELADDPAAALMFDGLPVNRPERTLLVRSGQAIVAHLQEDVPVGPRGEATELQPPGGPRATDGARLDLGKRSAFDSAAPTTVNWQPQVTPAPPPPGYAPGPVGYAAQPNGGWTPPPADQAVPAWGAPYVPRHHLPPPRSGPAGAGPTDDGGPKETSRDPAPGRP